MNKKGKKIKVVRLNEREWRENGKEEKIGKPSVERLGEEHIYCQLAG
jgi:hypothetical protein